MVCTHLEDLPLLTSDFFNWSRVVVGWESSQLIMEDLALSAGRPFSPAPELESWGNELLLELWQKKINPMNL